MSGEARLQFKDRPVRWVLDRTPSAFASVIAQRLTEAACMDARSFSFAGQEFAQIRFERPDYQDLVVPLNRGKGS